MEDRRILPLLYVLSGAANVLLIKWSGNTTATCSDGIWRRFQHPVVLTALMFFGQCLCYLVYKVAYFILTRREDGSENDNLITRGEHRFPRMRLLLPAFLDTVASMLLFTGLFLTYATSFQMIRGSAIILVGIFSGIFLNHPLTARHWLAMLTIAGGVFIIVGVDTLRISYDYASLPSEDANAILTGDLLIICAQVFHAAQFVYEEKHLKGSDMPAMLVAGWQGIFGLVITVLLGAALNFLPVPMPLAIGSSRGVFDDLTDLLPQLSSSGVWLPLALSLFVLCNACYSFVALSIVKYSSTTNRILADGLRVMFIWWMALLLEWEYLSLGALMGYLVLEMGAFGYRNAIFIEWYRSLLARLTRRRYADLTVDQDQGNDGGAIPTNRPADVI